jgi:hypothetical protein
MQGRCWEGRGHSSLYGAASFDRYSHSTSVEIDEEVTSLLGLQQLKSTRRWHAIIIVVMMIITKKEKFDEISREGSVSVLCGNA